jgi:hypothetical protein
MTRQRVFAVLAVLLAAFGLWRATRQVENAAKEVHRRGWRTDVAGSVLVAAAAAILALKKSRDVIIRVDEAFGAEAAAE